MALESRAWPRSSRGSPRSRSHSFWLPPARRRLLHKARSCSQPWLWAALLPTPQHPKIWGNSPSARLPCLPVLRVVTEGKEHPAPNPKKPLWDGDGGEQACFWGGGRDHAFPQALKQMFGGKASSGRRQEVLGAWDTHEPARCKHTSGAGGSACAGFPAALQQNFGWAQLQARREEASCVCLCSVGSPKTPPTIRHGNTFGPSIAVPRNNRAIHGLLSGLALFDASARNKKHTARLLVPKEKHLKAENAVPGLLEPAPSAVQSAARLEASLSVAFPPARRKNA